MGNIFVSTFVLVREKKKKKKKTRKLSRSFWSILEKGKGEEGCTFTPGLWQMATKRSFLASE